MRWQRFKLSWELTGLLRAKSHLMATGHPELASNMDGRLDEIRLKLEQLRG